MTMSPLTYRVTTFGCRVNHAETREMAGVLELYGFHEAEPDHEPDLTIIHTCSVTHAAARQSRQAIRHARISTNARERTLLVTGCYTGTDFEEAARLAGGEHHLLPHHPTSHAGGTGGTGGENDRPAAMLPRFRAWLEEWLHAHQTNGTIRATSENCCRRSSFSASDLAVLPSAPAPRAPGRHIRAEIKVQDGCDAHCTFCIIPRIRRTLRSKRLIDAVDEARRLVDLGHRELVLTGIFLGAYGHETALRRRQGNPRGEYLAELLDAVSRVPGIERVRLSSMEPGDVTPALLDVMRRRAPVVVPHLHLPLQSGSNAILRRMNRQYQVEDYRAMLAMIRAALTDAHGLPPALTTDVIVGFPGETDADFEATVHLAREAAFLHLHVFPYSPRAGTAAARWRNAFVDPIEVRRRMRVLLDLEHDPTEGLSIRYRRRLLGRTVRVISEGPDPRDPGCTRGRCDHYVRIHLPGSIPRGRVVSARVEAVTPDRTLAALIRPPVSLPVLR